MKEILLLVGRILVVAGILLMLGGVFSETNNVAVYSSAKADLEIYKRELEEKYKLEEPSAPINYAKKLKAPPEPAEEAAEEEILKYEELFSDYEILKKKEEEAFTEAQKAYKREEAEYIYQKSIIEYDKAKENEENQKRLKEKEKEISTLQTYINVITLNVFLRFFGAIILLLGALGVFIYGENMEKLGILILIGFAFKTILGL